MKPNDLQRTAQPPKGVFNPPMPISHVIPELFVTSPLVRDDPRGLFGSKYEAISFPCLPRCDSDRRKAQGRESERQKNKEGGTAHGEEGRRGVNGSRNRVDSRLEGEVRRRQSMTAEEEGSGREGFFQLNLGSSSGQVPRPAGYGGGVRGK